MKNTNDHTANCFYCGCTDQPHCAQCKAENVRRITSKGAGIRIDGHRGTWYVIGTDHFKGQPVFLLEHERHGDEAACLWVYADGRIALEDVWNGSLDLQEAEEAAGWRAPRR